MYGGQAGSNGAVIVAAATVIRLLPVSPSTARNLLFLLPTRKKPLLRHPGDFTFSKPRWRMLPRNETGHCGLDERPTDFSRRGRDRLLPLAAVSDSQL